MPAPVEPVPRRRSRAWVAVLIVGVSLLALLFCLVPIGLLASWFLYSSEDRGAQPRFEDVVFPGGATDPGEVLVKRFTTGDTPITTSIKNRAVVAAEDGWLIDSADTADYTNARDDLLPRVHLYQLEGLLEEPCRLTYRFQVKTENVHTAYFEARLQGETARPANKGAVLQGSTAWSSYEVSWDVEPGDRLNFVLGLDLVLLNGSAPRSRVWIRDVEVLKQVQVERTVEARK